jgi:hypothetical protein
MVVFRHVPGHDIVLVMVGLPCVHDIGSQIPIPTIVDFIDLPAEDKFYLLKM